MFRNYFERVEPENINAHQKEGEEKKEVKRGALEEEREIEREAPLRAPSSPESRSQGREVSATRLCSNLGSHSCDQRDSTAASEVINNEVMKQSSSFAAVLRWSSDKTPATLGDGERHQCNYLPQNDGVVA